MDDVILPRVLFPVFGLNASTFNDTAFLIVVAEDLEEAKVIVRAERVFSFSPIENLYGSVLPGVWAEKKGIFSQFNGRDYA